MKANPYWIRSGIGIRLAIVQRPRWGMLEDDIAALKEGGIENLVSLLTPSEAVGLGLEKEEEVCELNSVGFFSLPVTDGGVPSNTDDFMRAVAVLRSILINGGSVGIHCRAGIGRSCVLAACLMQTTGMDGTSALSAIEKARGCEVPETPEQRSWILQFS